MDWYIYIGTEKTGSSYLQALLARARPVLEDEGVCFPHGWAHDERCMRNGLISAGNARELARAMSSGDNKAIKAEVDKADSYARRAGANRVVLSSEWLLPALAQPKILEMFGDLLQKKGAQSVSLLVILRDPLEQCLSLYKHRAKRGTAGDIESWVKDGYRLPQELSSFRLYADQLKFNVIARAYSREPGALDQMFFEDWLGVPIPQVDVPIAVNPSLTLSELVLIRQMAQDRPDLVLPLYDALVAVPPEEKVQGQALINYSRAVVARAVAAHAEEWAEWNKRLQKNEQLTIPEFPESIPPCPDELGLSNQQMHAVSMLLAKAATPRFIAQLFWRSRVRPMVGFLKRRLTG